MIVGIGMDIIEVRRVKEAVEKNPRFLERIFTRREIDYSLTKKNKYEHLAARFAAKEAFFKGSIRLFFAETCSTFMAVECDVKSIKNIHSAQKMRDRVHFSECCSYFKGLMAKSSFI